MADVWAGWLMLSALVLGTILLAFVFVKYYSDPHEQHPLPTIVAVLTGSFAILVLLVIPIDILNVSSFQDKELEMQDLYYVVFSSLLICTFFLIPFAYFYFEEEGENIPQMTKVINALKFTSLFLVIIVILLVIGMILQSDSHAANQGWIADLLHDQSIGDSSLAFVFACISVVGFIGWLSYSAYGFSETPLSLMKGWSHADTDETEIADELAYTREQCRAIQSKYALTGRRMSRRDKRDLERLQRSERLLRRRHTRIRAMDTPISRCMYRIRPLFIAFGVLFMLTSCLVVLSLLISCIDKAVNSECRSECGFAVSKPAYFNPIDELLVLLSNMGLFPLDYIVFVYLLIFILLTTLGGIGRLGVRFLWIRLFRLRPHSSAPQSILLTAFHLAFVCVVLCTELLYIAPQYVTFGSQTFIDDHDHISRCSLHEMGESQGQEDCRMTQIATFLHLQTANTPFFGMLYFIGNWLFLLSFTLCFVVGCSKTRGIADDDQEEHESLI